MNLAGLELKVPPVIVVAVCGWLMWVFAMLLPWFGGVLPGRLAVLGLCVTAGVAVALAGVVAFRRSRTTVNPLRPETASVLVDTGVYRYTRNPMYLGMALALLGWGIYLSNPAALCGLFAFVAYMNRFQVGPEERALKALFGQAFADYQSRVPRWI
jgi:protein-S-isoprenylcysteine O-methyltransferase Ste14